MFSEREREIIKLIGRRKVTLQEIAEELFRFEAYRPIDFQISVGNSVRRIMKKCKHYKLDWTLTKKKEGPKFLISKEKV